MTKQKQRKSPYDPIKEMREVARLHDICRQKKGLRYRVGAAITSMLYNYWYRRTEFDI